MALVSMRAHNARPCASVLDQQLTPRKVSMRAHSARPCALITMNCLVWMACLNEGAQREAVRVGAPWITPGEFVSMRAHSARPCAVCFLIALCMAGSQ